MSADTYVIIGAVVVAYVWIITMIRSDIRRFEDAISRKVGVVDVKIRVFDYHIYLWADRRCVVIPVSRFPRLANATNEELQNYRIIGGGLGIHWPMLNEDLSVPALMESAKCGDSTTVY